VQNGVLSSQLAEIAPGNFGGHYSVGRRQKAWFLPAAHRNRIFQATGWALAMSVVWGLAAAPLLAKDKPEIVLQELVQMFPGHYDNTAQVQAETSHGVQAPHEAVVLDIVPIDAIMIGDNVFYVQESIAGDPNRVLGQKLVMFGVVKKEIVQTDFALAEPHRWRNGHLNPDLFKSLMVQDVHSNKGCSLRWKRTADDSKLVAANEPKTCHARVAGVGAMASVQVRAELGPVEYATSEQVFDKTGHPTQAHQDDPFYRFRKISHESD
jgi:hypothetical protein